MKPACPFCGYVYDHDAREGQSYKCRNCGECFNVGESSEEATLQKREFEEKLRTAFSRDEPSEEVQLTSGATVDKNEEAIVANSATGRKLPELRDIQRDTVPPCAQPKPIAIRQHGDWVSLCLIAVAVGIVLCVAIFNPYVNSKIGVGMIKISPHKITRETGDFSWRFFYWGILKGDVPTNTRFWLIDHIGLSYKHAAALDITNPTPFMSFLACLLGSFVSHTVFCARYRRQPDNYE